MIRLGKVNLPALFHCLCPLRSAFSWAQFTKNEDTSQRIVVIFLESYNKEMIEFKKLNPGLCNYKAHVLNKL